MNGSATKRDHQVEKHNGAQTQDPNLEFWNRRKIPVGSANQIFPCGVIAPAGALAPPRPQVLIGCTAAGMYASVAVVVMCQADFWVLLRRNRASMGRRRISNGLFVGTRKSLDEHKNSSQGAGHLPIHVPVVGCFFLVWPNDRCTM